MKKELSTKDEKGTVTNNLVKLQTACRVHRGEHFNES